MSLVIEEKNIVRKHPKGGKYFKIKRFYKGINSKKWKFRRPANTDYILNRKIYDTPLEF